MRVAIMQPTYLPWCGYFGLMHNVDIFVFLDSVQFSKRSWQQRNKIKSANGEQWLTIPVLSKGQKEQKINQVKIDPTSRFYDKHIKTIMHNYKESPFFNEVLEVISNPIKNNNLNLAMYNIEIINSIKDFLGIETKTLHSSEIPVVGKKEELLSLICRELGATEYISPPGSENYLCKSNAFDKENIPVKYFNFVHPRYQQLFGDFKENMSVVDLLMNHGDESLGIIDKGSFIS